MSGENPFEFQQQVRENSEELQNYLKDLENWEKDMKKKEDELKLLKITEEDSIPPIRNSVSRSKKKSKHKKHKEKEKTTTAARISSFDYKAWEQFNIESELKKLDEEKKESSASEGSDTEEQMNIQQKKQLAILKKDTGNDFFKKGMYDSAINCYTIGMELDPENPLLPANRAMAFIKKEQFQAAENDCTTCLFLDPTYIKAYLRRATARRALKKFSLAEEDYLKILELEPENKSAQTELEKMRKDPENSGDGVVSPRKNNSDVENSKIKENQETPSGRLENLLNEMEQTRPFVIPSNVVDDNAKQSKLLKLSPSKESVKTKTPFSQVDDFSEIENVIKQLEQTLPPVPTAAYQFLTDWRKLSKYPDLSYQYLKQFPPEKLPIVFKHDMEAEIFCGILQTLSTSFIDNSEDVYSFMKFLTQVGRFRTLVLFLSSQEKKNLEKLLESLKGAEHLTSEVEELSKLYKIL